MLKQILIAFAQLVLASITLTGMAIAAPQSGAVPCQPKNEAGWNCVLHDVSMIRLLANPEAFDGKRIRTVAYLDLTDEGASAFLHREDQQASILRHALRLKGLPASSCRSGRYVTLEGVFHLPDTARWQPAGAAPGACLTCSHAGPDEDWLLPAGGVLDVMRCMPKP